MTTACGAIAKKHPETTSMPSPARHRLGLPGRTRGPGKRRTAVMVSMMILCLAPMLFAQQHPTLVLGEHTAPSINQPKHLAPTTNLPNVVGVGAFPISFSYVPAVPVVGYPVTFNANASGGAAPYTFFWTFGDLTNGTGDPISHTYGFVSLSYIVKLNVSSATGAFAVAYTSIKVQSDTTVASFTWTPIVVFAGEQVFFDASTSTDTIGQIVKFSWNFGDGTSGIGMVALHTYSFAGAYVVTLSTTDNSGVTASKSLGVWVHPALVLTVSSNATEGSAPFFVSFNATVSGGQSPYTYSWDFGDGSVSPRQAPIHNYTMPRLYRVQLTATDSLGHTLSKYLNITVVALPAVPTYLGVSEATLRIGGILTVVSIVPLTIFAMVRRRK